jgi:hypothetical protein
MAKPRTFISSTCFDLADARAALGAHLHALGHEPLLSESSSFGVTPKRHSHDACLDQVDTCDYFILIIGGRRGGTYVGSERSITNEEYLRAVKVGKPIITFVKRDVQTAFQVFKKNPKADLSGLVNDARVFDFLEMVSSRAEDNWVRPFGSVEEIKAAITAQFAYIALLFSRSIAEERSPKKGDAEAEQKLVRFPKQLAKAVNGLDTAEVTSITRGLKALHKVISDIQKSSASGKGEKLKTLWVFGRYAQVDGHRMIIDVDRLKQYTWGTTKGRRVFTQLGDFGVSAWYDDEPNGDGSYEARLGFKGDSDGEVSWALSNYVDALLKGGDEDWALERFRAADMTVYE